MNGIARAFTNIAIAILLMMIILDAEGCTEFFAKPLPIWVWIVLFIYWVVVNWDEK